MDKSCGGGRAVSSCPRSAGMVGCKPQNRRPVASKLAARCMRKLPGKEWTDHLREQFDPISRTPTTTAVLDFERPLVELDRRIVEVRQIAEENGADVTQQIQQLTQRAIELRQQTYEKLTPVQRLQVARHPSRPTFLDIAYNICDQFVELHGDRAGTDDPAVVCGLGNIQGEPFMMIGHQKGRNTKENIKRNFAMPQPQGYRKALRYMRYADKFGIPILTFVDTPGAFAGKQAEEQGQGEAIAYNLREMFGLGVPVISLVIGEGGSGGALAIGCANRSLILENAVYYVASPEACAAILWKSRDDTAIATEALKITSADLVELGVMDHIIAEPLGGAHRNPMSTFPFIRDAILEVFEEYKPMSLDEIRADRYNKFRAIGEFREFLVKGGEVEQADARRKASQGLTSRTGRWVENEDEKTYWDIFDTLMERWEGMLMNKEEYLLVPATNSRAHIKPPTNTKLPKIFGGPKQASQEGRYETEAQDTEAQKAEAQEKQKAAASQNRA